MEPPGYLARTLLCPDRTYWHLQFSLDRRHARQSPSFGSRRKRGDFAQAIGRSRGGRTTKLHGLADDRGRPRVLLLSGGNTNDISLAASLIAAAGRFRRLIADRGYDAGHLRRLLAE